jgi:OmpA-OmpF porin, OOP family
MKHLRNTATCLAISACFAPALVFAQSGGSANMSGAGYNPSWYVAPTISLLDPEPRFGADRRGEGLGLRFGTAVSPSWDVQVGVGYLRADEGANRFRQTTLGLDALYMFSRSNLRPFVLAGLGAERTSFSTPASKAAQTSPFVNLGFGAQYSFNDQWGMQADLRRTRSYLRDNNYPFNRADSTALTVGLTYTFEKPVAVMARAAPAPAYVAPAPVVAQAPPPPPPRAAPVPATPTPPPPPAAPRFERYTLSATELFAFDSAVLRMPQAKLDEIADVLNRNADVNNVTITGYTDRLGSEQYNMKLSQRRADTVKTYLTNKGVNASRLTSSGKGESNPVVQCTDKKLATLITCLEPNRRVEVEQFVIERRVQ